MKKLQRCSLCVALALTACDNSGSVKQNTVALPAAPEGVTATAGDGQNVLAWTPVEGAASYVIYWREEAGVAKGDEALTAASSPQSHTGLVNGTTYYYAVAAVNEAGEGPLSTEVSARPMPPLPAAPAAVTVAADNHQVSISWNEVTGATGYTIYFGTTTGVSTSSTSITNATSPYVHLDLDNGTTYFYAVTAHNLTGEGPLSAEVSATPTDVPGNLLATAEVSAVRLTWRTVLGATLYNVYFDTAPGVTKDSTAINGVGSPYTHEGLAADTTYYYRVAAVTDEGERELSAEVSAQPLPAAPTNLAVEPGEGTLRVTWDDNVVGAVSYRLYWSTTQGVPNDDGEVIENATTPYIHTPPAITRIYYRVAAMNAAGEGALSEEVYATPRPSAPQDLTATPVLQRTALAWSAVEGAEQYVIYRSDVSDFVPDSSSLLTTVPAGTSPPSFTDGAKAAAVYYYIVFARNAGGDSPPSDTVAATTNLIAFVTRDAGQGDLSLWVDTGENGLLAADAFCQMRAYEAGLEAGTFRAWLSDDTDDALCRIHGFSGQAPGCFPGDVTPAGPWIRTDGQPFGAPITEMIAPSGLVFTTPSYDELGERLDDGELYFTGTGNSGTATSNTCGNWGDSVATSYATGALTIETGYAWAGREVSTCDTQAHLLCMQTGPGPGLVEPTLPADYKLAFVTEGTTAGDLVGSTPGANVLEVADAICQAEATELSIDDRVFRAWLSTSSTSAMSRFASDDLPWLRLDRIQIAANLEELGAGLLREPLNLDANGNYLSEDAAWVWTGTDLATGQGPPNNCTDWTSTAAIGLAGYAARRDLLWSSAENEASCSSTLRLYCFEDRPQ